MAFSYGRGDKVPDGVTTINVTSRSADRGRELSPFFLRLPADPALFHTDQPPIFENYWQGCKVYSQNTHEEEPTQVGLDWRRDLFAREDAVRFPMGKGACPLYARRPPPIPPVMGGIMAPWVGDPEERLGYVESRVKSYAPVYEACVRASPAWEWLQGRYREVRENGGGLWLFDYDGNACLQQGQTIEWMLYNRKRIFGHAFVLAGMLRADDEDDDDAMPWKKPYDPEREHATSIPRWRLP